MAITVRLIGETQRGGRFATHATTQVVIEDTHVQRHRLINVSHSMRPMVADGANTSVCVCNFDHTPEFPASTKLEIGMLPDLANNAAIISYSLEILPIFFDFTRGDQIVVPLNEVNEQLVSSWLDSKLLQFTDTYLQVRSIEQYQQENMAVDPVCGMRINRAHAAASVNHAGKSYYFCVDDCRQKFLKEPSRYLAS